MEQQKIQLNLPTMGVPRKVVGKEKLYIIKEPVTIGRIYSFKCPDCGFTIAKKIQTVGQHKHICPNCKTIIGFGAAAVVVVGDAAFTDLAAPPKAVDKAVEVPKEDPGEDTADKHAEALVDQPAPKPENKHNVTDPFGVTGTRTGEIVWGGAFSQKRYVIGFEPVTIGRKDKDEPSTISLNDDYVSRRSAVIERIVKENGVLYKFTVLKASNPVFVNGRELLVGNSIYLNYEDTIKLGKTTLTFKKAKK